MSTFFEYGEVSFSIPTRWLTDYVVEGRASSAEDALDVLWMRFRARSSPSDAEFLARLKCWNVPADPENGIAADAFWPTGGALAVFAQAMRLAWVYRDYARDDISGTGYCDGLPGFIEDALRSRRTTTAQENQCAFGIDVRVHARDGRFDEDITSGCLSRDPFCCGEGYEACGPAADRWTPVWDSGDSAWKFDLWDDSSGGKSYPDTGCGLNGHCRNLSLDLFAVAFSTEGYIADFLMWWARLALDYWSEHFAEPDAISYLDAASKLARFVLRRILVIAQRVVHELGHCWIDAGGHCEKGCCMTIASYAFQCAVLAELGLPVASDAPDYAQDSFGGGCDDGTMSALCIVAEVGQPGGSSTFTCTVPVCP